MEPRPLLQRRDHNSRFLSFTARSVPMSSGSPRPSIWSSLLASLLFLSLAGGGLAYGQDGAVPSDSTVRDLDRRARLYLDCDSCDETYIRRHLTFVDYVRDRKQADVHVLITVQQTGSRGLSYRLRFIGQGSFEGTTFELSYETPPTFTNDERRQGLTRRVRLGLGPFVGRTPLSDQISVRYDADSSEREPSAPKKDPWDQWVFEIGGSGYFAVEEQSQHYDARGSVAARRVTREWKFEVSTETEYQLDVFQPKDREETRSSSHDNAIDTEAIKSLGPHWGAGLSQRTFSRTATNKDLALRAQAALEYNIFPYRTSDRKELTFTYRIGPEYNDYQEVTIYGIRRQSLVQQSLEVSLNLNQPWGSIYSSVRGSHYFNDLTKNRLRLTNYLELQLVEGLSLQLSMQAGLIQDQLFLPASNLSQEEILLRRRELATNYQINASIGLSYTFGSIYNNVVNPRL